MTTPESVLGVLGMCRLYLPTLHTFGPVNTGLMGVCVRCVRFTRPRARVREKIARPIAYWAAGYNPKISLREALKTLHTLHTLHTLPKCIVFIEVFVCWVCVGFGFLCWVAFLARGVGQ